jgi:hypothetical protein
MDANTANGNLADKQLRVIPFLLAAASIEEGCKQAGVGKATVYGWLKQDAFREKLNRRRKEMVELGRISFSILPGKRKQGYRDASKAPGQRQGTDPR